MGKVKEHPILMSAEMVKAILSGNKTVTRRPVKLPEKSSDPGDFISRNLNPEHWSGYDYEFDNGSQIIRKNCPYGQPGDLLWVKETWGIRTDKYKRIVFKAGDQAGNVYPVERWRPSIHLKKQHARLWLQLQGVYPERLQDITEAEAKAEGTQPYPINMANDKRSYRDGFHIVWDKIYGKGSWDENPLVWRLKFELSKKVMQ